MSPRALRLGTRGSALALVQAELVAEGLRATFRGREVEIVTIKTSGDARTDVPLRAIGGRGVFVAELEQALRAGEVDLAVHSAKDLPSTLAGDLVLAAFLPREDPRDVVVSRDHRTLMALRPGAVVGTSSPRRACQIRALRPDLVLRDIRGNVDTRLRKLDAGDYDAIVLAAAGMIRLGLDHRVTERLSADTMLSAVGQGAIAVEVREDDVLTLAAAGLLDDRETRLAVTAERAFLARLGAGCSAPTGALALPDGDVLRLQGMIGADDGTTLRHAERGQPRDAARLGVAVAEALLAAGGDRLLAAAERQGTPA